MTDVENFISFTQRIRALATEADREHARIDADLAAEIEKLARAHSNGSRSSNGKAPRPKTVTPKGATAAAVVAALGEHGPLKLSGLAAAIGKTNSNTFNSTRRLVKKGTVVKSPDGFYSLAQSPSRPAGMGPGDSGAAQTVAGMAPATAG